MRGLLESPGLVLPLRFTSPPGPAAHEASFSPTGSSPSTRTAAASFLFKMQARACHSVLQSLTRFSLLPVLHEYLSPAALPCCATLPRSWGPEPSMDTPPHFPVRSCCTQCSVLACGLQISAEESPLVTHGGVREEGSVSALSSTQRRCVSSGGFSAPNFTPQSSMVSRTPGGLSDLKRGPVTALPPPTCRVA